MELDCQNDRLILEHHKKNASARLWERLALFDIKTVLDVYSDCMLQLATYALACGEMKGCLPEICPNLHSKTGFIVTEANRVTATELFAPFQTVLVAKQLSEWLSEQQTSARQNAAVAPFGVALSSNGGPT